MVSCHRFSWWNEWWLNRKQSAIFDDFLDLSNFLRQAVALNSLITFMRKYCLRPCASWHFATWILQKVTAIVGLLGYLLLCWWKTERLLVFDDYVMAAYSWHDVRIRKCLHTYSILFRNKNENMLTKMSAHNRGSCLLLRRSHSSFTAVRPARKGWRRACGYQFNII